MLGDLTKVPTEKGWADAIVLADRWIYDEEAIATAATQQEFFRTTAAKNLQQANFEGDYSIVPEGHVFQVLVHLVRIVRDASAAAQQRVTQADAVEVFDGYFDWRIQGATTDEASLYYVAGGFDFNTVYEPANLGNADVAVMGDGTHQNNRTYDVEKFIPGGRSIKYWHYWPNGIVLGANRRVQPAFYGRELMLKVG